MMWIFPIRTDCILSLDLQQDGNIWVSSHQVGTRPREAGDDKYSFHEERMCTPTIVF